MSIDEHIKYWIESAKNDVGAAEQLFKAKRYDWTLFIGHLVVEKTLKAYFVFKNNNKVPPKIHNLLRLVDLSDLVLNEEQRLFIDRVNDFNIEVRYPEYKNEFYKICNKDFAKKYFEQIKEFSKWLESQIKFKN